MRPKEQRDGAGGHLHRHRPRPRLALRPRVKEMRPQTTDRVPLVAVWAVSREAEVELR